MYLILKIKHTICNIKNNNTIKKSRFKGELNEEVHKNNICIISSRIIS